MCFVCGLLCDVVRVVLVFVMCACVCSMCLYAVIVNYCAMMRAGICVVVCITCLMCPCVVCDVVVWLYDLSLCLGFVCAPCLNACECSGCDLRVFVIHCVMLYDVFVMWL